MALGYDYEQMLEAARTIRAIAADEAYGTVKIRRFGKVMDGLRPYIQGPATESLFRRADAACRKTNAALRCTPVEHVNVFLLETADLLAHSVESLKKNDAKVAAQVHYVLQNC